MKVKEGFGVILFVVIFLAYMNQTERNNSMECDYDKPPRPDFVCRVNVDELGNCTAEEAYGYSTSQPCVFLKLNRVNFLLFTIHLFASSFFLCSLKLIFVHIIVDYQLDTGSI